jgi:chromosome segregation ATPase
MCKKLLIAAVAVLIGVVAVKGTRLGSYLKVWKREAATWAHKQVPPETEIARLRADIQSLSREDERLYDQVAKQLVDLDNREREVHKLQANLEQQEKRISDMVGLLKGSEKDEFLVYNGFRYPREDLQEQVRVDASGFKAAEESLKSKKAQLAAFRKTVEYNRKKLKELEQTRREMETELTRLETTLAEERLAQAQARGAIQVDDSHYARLREDMNGLRDRIAVMKKARELRGESVSGPVRAAEQAREKNAKLDQYIETRFGGKADHKFAGK